MPSGDRMHSAVELPFTGSAAWRATGLTLPPGVELDDVDGRIEFAADVGELAVRRDGDVPRAGARAVWSMSAVGVVRRRRVASCQLEHLHLVDAEIDRQTRVAHGVEESAVGVRFLLAAGSFLLPLCWMNAVRLPSLPSAPSLKNAVLPPP